MLNPTRFGGQARSPRGGWEQTCGGNRSLRFNGHGHPFRLFGPNRPGGHRRHLGLKGPAAAELLGEAGRSQQFTDRPTNYRFMAEGNTNQAGGTQDEQPTHGAKLGTQKRGCKPTHVAAAAHRWTGLKPRNKGLDQGGQGNQQQNKAEQAGPRLGNRPATEDQAGEYEQTPEHEPGPPTHALGEDVGQAGPHRPARVMGWLWLRVPNRQARRVGRVISHKA